MAIVRARCARLCTLGARRAFMTFAPLLAVDARGFARGVRRLFDHHFATVLASRCTGHRGREFGGNGARDLEMALICADPDCPNLVPGDVPTAAQKR